MRRMPAALALACLAGCAPAPSAPAALVGAWQAQVQFHDGPFAGVRDLQFLYVYNAGGTMTESSNYDGAPPVPPAYGEWRASGPNRYEAKYTFFTTQPPAQPEQLAGGGWPPAGSGVLTEHITLAADGRSYKSALTLEMFDRDGKPAAGGAQAKVSARRAGF